MIRLLLTLPARLLLLLAVKVGLKRLLDPWGRIVEEARTLG